MSEGSHTTEIDDFKTAVHNYITLSDELVEIQNTIKERKNKLKKLNEYILAYMKDNEKELCKLGDGGMLLIKKRKTKQSFKKDDIERVLCEYLKNEDMAKNSTEYIFEHQNVKETDILHRT